MDPVAARALTDLVADVAAEPMRQRDPAASEALEVSRVRRHLLGPLAYYRGGRAFRKDYAAASLLVPARDAVVAEAIAAFGVAGIPVILLKGCSYATTIYPDPALRPMSDVDLLVQPRDHGRASATLRRLGYWHVGKAAQLSPWHHAVGFKRDGAAIDLHRHILQMPRSSIDLRALWSRAHPAADILGAHRLDPIDELIFHLAHMARHELWVPLINYVDAARLWARLDSSAHEVALTRAREWRIHRMIDGALAAVGEVVEERFHRRWWLPDRNEILTGASPTRAVQIGRKLLFVDGPWELIGLGVATLRAQWSHRSSRRS